MVYLLLLKRGVYVLFISLLVPVLFYPPALHSEVFNVTNEDELRSALSTAESNGENDVINIEAGLYHTGGAKFTYESIEDFSITVQGAGAVLTILDGDNRNRVLKVSAKSDSDVFISISGLTIQNGFFISRPGYTPFPIGAGIIAVSQNLTIEGCEFINNTIAGAGDGGGLYASASNTVNLSKNLFSNNSADGLGGGAYLTASKLNISGNQFIDNSAIGSGGGAYISGIKLYLNDNEFYGNVSGVSSGGLYGVFYSQEISNVNLINNIFALNNSFMSGNRVGGAVSILGAEKVNIINNTLTMNSSGTESSALTLEIPYGRDNITNIYNNIAIANDIIDGADIRITGQPYPVPTSPPTGFPKPVTIDYGTVNLFNNDVAVFVVKEPFVYCDIGEVTCLLEINEDNNIIEDPLFVDAETGDFSLLSDSPCIDAGDPNAPDVPNNDIYENPRMPPPDMGAVEYIAQAANNGGCSLTDNPTTSPLAVFLALPILILIRRIIKI
jgi:hypothetical protein